MASPRPFFPRFGRFLVVQASLLRRKRPRVTLLFLGALVSLAIYGLWWLSLADCGSHADDLFAPSYPLAPFPLHVRASSTSNNARAPVEVVYVTAFPRNALSSLRSLCYFAATDALGTVHLVVPDRMVSFFSSAPVLAALQCPTASAWVGLSAPILSFKVWPESQLVPRFAPGASYSGTTRQMTLKLAAATIVTSPFYLIMDSDVYARRPFARKDLFDTATGTRARVNIDQNDYCQPATWFNQASRVLGSRLVADVEAYCGHVAATAGFPSVPPPHSCPSENDGSAPPWFLATGNTSVPDAPFSLIEDPTNGRTVFGACRAARGHASHVTPAILAREIVIGILAPRVESEAVRRSSSSSGGGGGRGSGGVGSSPRLPRRLWLDALLDYHEDRASVCRQGAISGRFYSWTEYALYFVAAAASNAMGQYHTFAEGGITSIKWSMMEPYQYDEADWRAIFTDALDSRPFFIVHSWIGKSIEQTDANLAQFIPTLNAEETSNFPAQPSPAPFY